MRQEMWLMTGHRTYNGECYWDFLQLIRKPMWSSIGLVLRQCPHANVLTKHQAMARDVREKQSLQVTFKVAWADFFERVVKKHFPHYLPVLEEL